MKSLFLIPARGGSKGIPGKNIKPLANKPLILYAVDTARNFADDEHICVSTDDDKIIETVESYGLKIPFKRPDDLAKDNSGTYEVIMHSLEFYRKKDIHFDVVVLLQPTSPFRNSTDVKECLRLFNDDLDMVTSVKESKANPYYNLFEENGKGFLVQSKAGNFSSRQACPAVYEQNGAVYVMNVKSLLQKNIADFTKVKKYVMEEQNSLDLDTPLDWAFAEFLIEKKFINNG
ncbi:MAG: acylneuraminate cytidylyltransferase family protein [Bacteroidia bacterium]